jgi:membrane AbrB-like protein
LVNAALTLTLGAAGGWVAMLLALPLPWMIGAMLATTVPAALGAPMRVHPKLRTAMVTVLGVMLGSQFTPEILGQLDRWVASLTILLVYVVVSGGLAVAFLRKVCRYDRVTAYFSAMPGGLSEMILIGTAMGGDARVISLSHASRILLVVMTLPFAFQFALDYDTGDRPPAGMPIAEMPGVELAILAAAAVVGYLLARLLRVPAAQVVGPMLVSAAVHLAGISHASPPIELVAASQVVIGAAIGSRFAGVDMRFILRAVAGAAGVTAVLMATTVAFALVLTGLTDAPLSSLVLAYAPGGLAEMSLIALALSIDTAFVATHHIVRIFMVVVLAPMAFRLLGGKARHPKT